MEGYSQPRIVCAATKFLLQDGTTIVIASPRHYDQTCHLVLSRLPRHTELEQGFLDQRGAFYERGAAWHIAKAAGQIIKRCGGDERTLFSENLY